MRFFRVALVLFFAMPGIAWAGGATLVARDLPLPGNTAAHGRVLASAGSPRFNLVGLHWRGPGVVRFRAHLVAGGWSPWFRADDDSTAPVHGWHYGNPEWTGTADRIDYRAAPGVRALRAYYVWSPVERTTPRRISLAGSPLIVPRAGWGADERIVRSKPHYATSVRMAVVHHTVNLNDYGPLAAAAIVRGIEVYHVKGNGWDDIGYNFLVDRYGQVYEGRAGGIDRNVIGAHSQGFNTATAGVALIGNFTSTPIPAAARAALVKLLAWRLDVAHVDPLSTLSYFSGGNTKFPAGKPVLMRAISGHRDTYFTECPGRVAYAAIPAIAKAVSATGLPKLYEPLAAGSLGGRIRFTARLSSAMPWTVTVKSAVGAVVATGKGRGANVDWTWDATAVPKGAYSWSIEAGASVRPASGSIGAVAPPVTTLLSGVTASPLVVTPNADGTNDSLTVGFALGGPANVTVNLLDPGGATLLTLLNEPRLAGPQSFDWQAHVVPDGRYRVLVTARTLTGKTASAYIDVIVDRTLGGFAATPLVVSPNGDGMLDIITFSFGLAATVPFTLRVDSAAGATVATVFSGTLEPGPHAIDWDPAPYQLPDGAYRAVATVTDGLGNVSLTLPFAIDTTPPVLTILSAPQLRFSLSEPGTVTLLVNNRRVVKVEPKGTFSIPYQGEVTTLSGVATDAGGNTSAPVRSP